MMTNNIDYKVTPYFNISNFMDIYILSSILYFVIMIKRGFSVLSSSQLNFYKSQGYLVLPNFVEKSRVDELKSRTLKLIEEWNTVDYNIFTTNKQTRTTNEYFLESAENISFFFEERANEANSQDKAKLINKLGHAMHDLYPVFERFSHSPSFRLILADIGYKKPQIVQSM